MSAIGGVLQLNGETCDQRVLERLGALLAHRAPDGIATWSDGPAGLVHGRSVTTPESLREQQPERDVAAGTSITFDGRLDNRDELFDRLRTDAVDRHAMGDAALVLQLYAASGLDCVPMLLGDFAFALWDGRLGRLIGARDHLGLKPFCYRQDGDQFAWASEPGVLARYNGRIPAVNEGMVAEQLTAVTTSQQDTLFLGIHRLPPAHLLTVERDGRTARRCYWTPDLCREIRYASDDDYAAHLRVLVQQAVRTRLRACGPVGISLSGGVDSSSVTGIAVEWCRAGAVSADGIEAFSVLDPGEGDESAFWSQVVDRWQIPSQVIPVAPLAHGALSAEARLYLDLPNSSNAGMTDRLRASMRERGVRVALTGTGADDWFGTSPWAYADLVKSLRVRALVHRLRRDAAGPEFVGWPSAAKGAIWPLLPAPVQWSVRRLLGRGRAPEWINTDLAKRVDLRERLSRHAVHLPCNSWERYDTWHEAASGGTTYQVEIIERSCARTGVDMWHPFLDTRILEFGLALPPDQRWRDGRAKDLLRRAMAPYLPTAIAERLTSPGATHLLLSGLDTEGGRTLFENMTIARHGWVNEPILQARFDLMSALYRAGDPRYHWLVITLWRVAAVELWARAMAAETMVQ